MRITHLLLNHHPVHEARLLDLVAGLNAHGHQNATVTLPKANINASLRMQPISHLVLPVRFGERDTRAVERLGPLLRTLRSHVIICHDALSLVLSQRAVGEKIPIIALSDGEVSEAMSRADMVLTASRRSFPKLIQSGILPERLFHLPPMIASRGGFIRSVWQKPPTIVVSAPLQPRGGIEVFLQALALLQQQNIEFRALILGSGYRLIKLKYLVHTLKLQRQVSFIAPPREMDDLLLKSDLFCYPALEEPDGVVLLPAMAAKLPILTTDTRGPGEMLENGREGLIVPRGDAEAMAVGLRQLLEDEDSARTLASNAFHRLKRHYARDRVCQVLSERLMQLGDEHLLMRAGA